jgi:hypothetical protein
MNTIEKIDGQPDVAQIVPQDQDAAKAPVTTEAVTPEAEPTASYFVVIFWENEEHHRIDRKLHTELTKKLEAITSSPENTEIDVWIDSGGGDPHIAYKILLSLRSRCRKLRAVIPDYAKSAATLLVLGMDEIFMGPSAELGPLDVQVSHPLREELTVSALDVSGAIEYLGRLALSLASEGGPMLLEMTGLSRADVLREVLPFAARVVKPAIAQLDPHLVYRARSQLRITREYAERSLAMRNVSEEEKLTEDRVAKLCNHFVTDYPTHAFVISRAEAKECGLPIRNLEKYHAMDLVNRLHNEYTEKECDICHVIKAGTPGSATPSS